MTQPDFTDKLGDKDRPLTATEAGWGYVSTDKTLYKPLEQVSISIRGPAQCARTFRVEWYDGLGRRYGHIFRELQNNSAVVNFNAGGFPGMQFIKVCFDPVSEGDPHDRLVNFYLEAQTQMTCDDKAISEMYEISKQAIRLNRRRYTLPEGEVIGYTTADSGNGMDFWLRDMFYNSGGYLLWEHDVTSGLEANWSRQRSDGHFPDWVDDEGQSDRMPSESDVEYIAVLALYRTWMVTGDKAWLEKYLPVVEHGLRYLTSNPIRWDEKLGMIKRGHTCDTWDFDIETDQYHSETRAVAAICDQTGLYAAYLAMSTIYAYLDDETQSIEYRRLADELRQRCENILWDGEKFRHHVHLTSIDHDGFDEGRQLAMGNGWAMIRGLASHSQCLMILRTYEERWKKTGHRFPWWSLEPGYPIDQGQVLKKYADYLQPGGYCNGGMMPFVGATLSLAAFQHGREDLGARLLSDYAKFIEEQGGQIYTWYWPNMQPGFRTTTNNTTGHDGWGMGHWVDALVEGVTGLRILEPKLNAVEISPRWVAAGIHEAHVVVHFSSVDRYVAYDYYVDRGRMVIRVTGSMKQINLRILVPTDLSVENAIINNIPATFEIEQIEKSNYLLLKLTEAVVWEIQIYLTHCFR
ncbi:MAG: hypothetical protein WC975_00725 [Phycisphaerae bacterium]